MVKYSIRIFTLLLTFQVTLSEPAFCTAETDQVEAHEGFFEFRLDEHILSTSPWTEMSAKLDVLGIRSLQHAYGSIAEMTTIWNALAYYFRTNTSLRTFYDRFVSAQKGFNVYVVGPGLGLELIPFQRFFSGVKNFPKSIIDSDDVLSTGIKPQFWCIDSWLYYYWMAPLVASRMGFLEQVHFLYSDASLPAIPSTEKQQEMDDDRPVHKYILNGNMKQEEIIYRKSANWMRELPSETVELVLLHNPDMQNVKYKANWNAVLSDCVHRLISGGVGFMMFENMGEANEAQKLLLAIGGIEIVVEPQLNPRKPERAQRGAYVLAFQKK